MTAMTPVTAATPATAVTPTIAMKKGRHQQFMIFVGIPKNLQDGKKSYLLYSI